MKPKTHKKAKLSLFKKWLQKALLFRYYRVLGTNLAVLVFAPILVGAFFVATNIFAQAPEITVNPSGYTNIDNFTFTLSEAIPGAAKYQYRTGGDDVDTWVDFSPVLSTTVTIPNANHPDGKYQQGENLFYFRALDSGNNVLTNLSKSYYYAISPPDAVVNLSVNPWSNTQNSFTISWDPPTFYFGNVNNIKYRYSVNTIPSVFNTTTTTQNQIGPSSFATVKGDNAIYVVAEDEAGNINYDSYATEVFTANTTAPPTPTGIQIDDISNKDANQYRLAISWLAPSFLDPGNFKGYDVYSATSAGGPFTKIATTTETSYVQTNLTKDTQYFYYITSTDKTANVSAPSTTVNAFATGRYTRPPNVTKDPDVLAMSKKATVSWVTERAANSSVEFGKTIGLGQSIGNSVSDFVTDHIVTLTNLEPDTTYYYKAVFVDPDGNIGQTTPGTFKTSLASIVSDLKIEEVTISSMTVSWDTNMPAYGELMYGKTSALGSTSKESGDYIKKHSIKLTGLADGTEYFIKAKQTDQEGGTFFSDEYRKATLPIPQVSNVKIEPKLEVDSPTITIEYATNVETTALIRYTPEGGKTLVYASSEYTKSHLLDLTNLVPLTLYNVEISARDRFGNEAVPQISRLTTLSDSMPPKITKISEKKKVSGEGANAEAQLIIKLQTDEPSTAVLEATKGISHVEYNIISNEDALNTEHTIVLKLGESGLPYSYRIKLKDASGNESVTEPKTIVVTKAKKGALDYVLGAFTKVFGWLGSFIN